MGGFERLHPHLQHGIVHDLGWRELRPVQDLTIDAVLDGHNAVVLAPTAGGKTEASIFPVLSRVLTESIDPVAALYVCPIRALLNNQEERIQGYARMVGLDAFKWHGDVPDSTRRRFRRSPAHILMTTPESLEVMLISAKTDAEALFRSLSMVIVDEVHAFAGDDRGAHLTAVLERLTRFCNRDVQRIGLSATVGNPHVIGQWLQGSSSRPFSLVDPPKGAIRRDLFVDYTPELGDAARAIGHRARGRKSLVFVESRSKAERVAHALSGSGVEVFIHHSSVSRADRALAEAQFAGGQNTAIVCTSTMELGIDVGDLDQVIQVDAPTTVASFLQRMGRTGRRPGTRPNCAFFCLEPESLIQSLALLRLAERGWVEDVRPTAQAIHVLAHQVLALSLQIGGLSRHRVLEWVHGAYPFAGLREEHVKELVETMLERDILYESDGLLSLGARGERLYGRKNFFELYAVFSAPPVMHVLHGRDEVGYVQALFVSMHDESKGPLCFRLAGRAWQVAQREWSRGVLRVRPADHGRVPSWLGLPGSLSPELCGAMKELLLSEGSESAELTRGAELEVAALRDSYGEILEPGSAVLEDAGDSIQWHTFAGGGVNRLLAAGLESETGKRWVAGNLSVRCKDVSSVQASEAVHSLAELDWDRLAAAAAHDMARGQISKLQPCMPRDAEDRLLADRLLDLPATLRFLNSVSVGGRRIAGRTRGVRLGDGDLLELPIRRATADNLNTAEPANPVVWVDTPTALDEAVAALSEQPRLGLDVETTLDSQALCLIQLASVDRTYLVDVLALTDLGPLGPLLAAETPAKLIHHAAFERRVLAEVGLVIGGVVDTLELSRRVRGVDALGGHSLAMVCERELGVVLDKAPQTSNWSRRPLDEEQLRYAALDAEVLLRVFAQLGSEADGGRWVPEQQEDNSRRG